MASKEEAQPGTGGGAGVLTSEKEPDQQACYLIICQRPAISMGNTDKQTK